MYIENITAFATNATNQLIKLQKEKTWVANETFASVANKLLELTEWIANKTNERKTAPATSEPILTQYVVDAKKVPIKVLLKEIRKIKKPKPKPVAKIGRCPAKNASQIRDELLTCPIINRTETGKEDL